MRWIALAMFAAVLGGCGSATPTTSTTAAPPVTATTITNVMTEAEFSKAVTALGHPFMKVSYDHGSDHWAAAGKIGQCDYELDQSSAQSRDIELDKFGGKDDNLKASALELPSLQNVKYDALTKATAKPTVKKGFTCLK